MDNFRFEPGDLIRATRQIHAWANDWAERDDATDADVDSGWIVRGDLGIVLQTWDVGHTTRMRLLFNDRIGVFACFSSDLTRNWRLVAAGGSARVIRQATASGSR